MRFLEKTLEEVTNSNDLPQKLVLMIPSFVVDSG